MSKPRRCFAAQFALFADDTEEPLVKFLEGDDVPLTMRIIDVSHCILANPDQLLHCISRCTRLRSLRCVACPFTASDVLDMLLHRIRLLECLHFSLIAKHDVARDMTNILKMYAEGASVSGLDTLYAEVRGASNLALLEAFVSCCPNLTEMHFHFLDGEVPHAISFCQEIIEVFLKVRKLTFSCERPACFYSEVAAPLNLRAWLRICANTVYRKGTSWNYSCVHLVGLATRRGGGELPRQIAVVAVYDAELLEESINACGSTTRWRSVCELCLVLLPRDPRQIYYPTIGAEFRLCLEKFFICKVRWLVELNVNSFHFGVEFDLTDLIRHVKLECLRALSTPPCGIRYPLALQRLAEGCNQLEELDVRVYRRGHLVRCTACEASWDLPADGAQLNAYAGPMLYRLTLGNLPTLACFSLPLTNSLEDLRLLDLPEDEGPLFAWLNDLFLCTRYLECLLLQQGSLPFGDGSFLVVLSRLRMLRSLCLLTSFAATDDVMERFLENVSVVLDDLKAVHLHYRRAAGGAEQRVTWFRSAGGPGSQSGRGVLLRDHPCIMCSTATFIGLAKPKAQRPNFTP